MPTYVITSNGDCCCGGVPVDCPGCPTIAENYLFTITATGDLAFLDGQTLTVNYVGLSGGFYNFRGTLTVSGWLVTVSWGISAGDNCLFVAGNIVLFNAGECGGVVQEMSDPASTTSLSRCDPSQFTIQQRVLYPNGLFWETPCFTGTIGGVGDQI